MRTALTWIGAFTLGTLAVIGLAVVLAAVHSAVFYELYR